MIVFPLLLAETVPLVAVTDGFALFVYPVESVTVKLTLPPWVTVDAGVVFV